MNKSKNFDTSLSVLEEKSDMDLKMTSASSGPNP